jgi:hypothetical protein
MSFFFASFFLTFCPQRKVNGEGMPLQKERGSFPLFWMLLTASCMCRLPPEFCAAFNQPSASQEKNAMSRSSWMANANVGIEDV